MESQDPNSSSSSSLTEGPDSPDSMEEDFKLTVHFQNEISKNGSCFQYTLHTCSSKNAPNFLLVLRRTYENFETLHLSLQNSLKHTGILFPPFPPIPQLKNEGKAKKASSSLGTDDVVFQCQWMEFYIRSLLHHPRLISSKVLIDFLREKEFKGLPLDSYPEKRSFFFGVLENLEARKSVVELDSNMQSQKDWLSRYQSPFKDTFGAFVNMLSSQIRLSNQMAHLSVFLSGGVGGHEGPYKSYNQFNSLWSSLLGKIESKTIEDSFKMSSHTLGLHFEIYSSYLDSVLKLHSQRNARLSSYLNSLAIYEKAKNSDLSAKIKKIEAEREYLEWTESVKKELERFQRIRVEDFKKSLFLFVEKQVSILKESSFEMREAIDRLQNFECAH